MSDNAIMLAKERLANQLELAVGDLSDKEARALLVGGDLGVLSPAVQTAYYGYRCKQLGLDPLSRPFDLLALNGRVVLYANKTCADQLRAVRQISVEITQHGRDGDYLFAEAVARMPDGRVDFDTGYVWVGTLKGEALANAHMKVITKAKRRVTLSICGAGMLDESEIESVPGAQPVQPAPVTDMRTAVLGAMEDVQLPDVTP